MAPPSAAYESTLPPGTPDLVRVSAFKRYLEEVAWREGSSPGATRIGSLSPTLRQDLLRFEQDGSPGTVVDVLAASMRHQRALLVHLQCGSQVVPVTVFPFHGLLHCPLSMERFYRLRLADVQVLQVEPAILRPPGDPERARVGQRDHYAPLSPLLWELAMRGPREELLPEIAGNVAYRVGAGVEPDRMAVRGMLAAAVARLKRETATLRDLAGWPGFDRARASRLLNALYLHAALMVSRTHPAATNEGWGR